MSFSIAAPTAAARAGGVATVVTAVGIGVGARVGCAVGAWVGTGVGRAVGAGAGVGGSVGFRTGALVSGTEVGAAGATTQLASSHAAPPLSSHSTSRRLIGTFPGIMPPSASGVPERRYGEAPLPPLDPVPSRSD